ncbi:ATP-binding protein [Streptomyces sp. NPDC001373]|uniref:ATP-binding protein n=1 Tax=Streptomyces sp. NPDC001373 TaxID=3364565 RepID=UPI0036804A9E
MSTLADIDFRAFDDEVIDLEQLHRKARAAASPGLPATDRGGPSSDRLVRPIEAEAAGTVVPVVSELVTNALRHADGTCTLDLTAHPDSIDVAVHDLSPQAPRMRTPDLNGGTGGFGWPIWSKTGS